MFAADLGVERTLTSRDRLGLLITVHGIAGTARILGRSESTIRVRARELGIPPGKPGRRRGVTELPVARDQPELDPTLTAVNDRYARWTTRRVPATETTLAAAIHAAHQARDRDPNAYDSALIDIAAAAALVHAHRRKLRRAA